MTNKYELDEAKRTLESNRELVSSMIHDTNDLDAPLVRIWIALAAMISEVESGEVYTKRLQARIRMLEGK